MVFIEAYEASKWRYDPWVARVLEFSCLDPKLSLETHFYSVLLFFPCGLTFPLSGFYSEGWWGGGELSFMKSVH